MNAAAAGRGALLAAGALVAAIVVAEGSLSLFLGRSLRELAASQPAALAPREDERLLGEAPPAGPWRVHEDPRVGFTLRTDAEVLLHHQAVVTDELGLRRRVGPGAPPDALSVLVVGDSVAFGWGVPDEQTLAQHLEDALAAAALPGAPPVACRTVAVPGWNHRNAVAFVLDHWDALQPDVVLFLPIGNDLADGYGVTETGQRHDAADVSARDPWLRVSRDQTHFGALALWLRFREAGREPLPEQQDLGPLVLEADLSPESSRRYDENADSLVLLAETLAQRGGRLLLLQYTEGTYEWILWSRLAERLQEVPLLPLLAHVPTEFTLPGDPHPSAETQRVFALWCAAELVARGWVAGRDGAALPRAPEAYERLRGERHPPAVWQARAAEARERLAAALRPDLSLDDGRGIYQIYGGVNPDGTAREHVLLLLAREHDVLQLLLAPLPERPDLYPLEVAVEVDGRPVGSVRLEAGGPTRSLLPLPPSERRAFEVRLRAPRAVVTLWEGRTQMSAYRLLSASCKGP